MGTSSGTSEDSDALIDLQNNLLESAEPSDQLEAALDANASDNDSPNSAADE